jgi:pyrroline-5-carboxylate reductase
MIAMLDQISLGLCGVGRMGAALAKCLAGKVREMWAYDVRREALAEVASATGLRPASSSEDLATRTQVLMIAVKPKDVSGALAEMRPVLTKEHIVISIAAGVPIARLRELCGDKPSIVRAMPNVLVLVGQASTAVASDSPASESALAIAKAVFSAVGRVVMLPEALMDAVTGLSGSGPAFVFTFIEALADGGVAAGLPRDQALELAAQTVLGSARMVLEKVGHPAALREMVTSPAGTTIAGLAALESRGFRAACMEAVQAAARRASELAKA